MEELNIYQKLAKIRKAIEVVKKNKKGYGYTYADEEEILSKVTGLMDKLELSLMPKIVPDTMYTVQYDNLKTKFTKEGTKYEDHSYESLVHADMVWTWINNVKPDEKVEIPWALIGCQSDPSQAFGSALTYSSRYFLLKFFNVATTDDDPELYRKKQKEAEETENRLVAGKIIEEISAFVSGRLEKFPNEKESISALIKKYVKVNGKASSNWLQIQDPEIASNLLAALKENFSDKKKQETNEEVQK